MNVASVPTLEINGVIADFAAEALRDCAGAPIPLRPQAFAVLRHLAANPNRLVTKDELMDTVWPGISVTDDSLVQAVRDIRRAIGDESHTLLRTVPRRGYLLDPAADARPATAARPGRRGLLAVGVALALACVVLAWWLVGRPAPVSASIAGPPIIAVVPFVDLADDEASRDLALAIGYGRHPFIFHLTRFREFQIVGRSETFVHRDKSASGLEIDFVLGGTIQREGERLRLTAELTDPSTGALLWSERWDRPDRDVPAFWAEVGEQISNRLGGRTGVIQQAGRALAQRKRPGDRTAWENFLLGTGQLARGTRAGAAEAAMLLDLAVDLDPGLAHASGSHRGKAVRATIQAAGPAKGSGMHCRNHMEMDLTTPRPLNASRVHQLSN
jgi:TolB-like protein/DNA-binding winged helix-turn-helix (wHTH) protein